MKTLIKNARMVSDGCIGEGDLLIAGDRIEKIAKDITPVGNCKVIDAGGKLLLPGAIDDQVHFREPGLTHKATIGSESAAAVAGGVTTFFEQPNTMPQTISIERLEEKFAIAGRTSYANYSFFLGGTNDNLEELKRLDRKACAGVKLFLGSSTGNMLVDNERTIEEIFSNVDLVIAAHCEDEATIRKNLAYYESMYGENIPMGTHPLIRSAEACYLSSSRAIALAEKTGARLHVFHLSTARETELFRNDIPLKDKKITAEVCVHHLWFSDADYAEKGSLIKWNPAVKTAEDRSALWTALLDDRLDVIATDHAPHHADEKNVEDITKAPSGMTGLETSLSLGLTYLVEAGALSLMELLEKMSYNPAKLYNFEAGYLSENGPADITIFDDKADRIVDSHFASKAANSPFIGESLKGQVKYTICNGQIVYKN